MRLIVLSSCLACVTGAASAGPILSFGYTDLWGSFDTGSATFTAAAADAGEIQTAGDVTRLADPVGTANFDIGFVTASAFADVQLSMTVSPIDVISASGVGNITLTDDDGDTIMASIDGVFTSGGNGIYYFEGLLSEVTLSGTTFNGTNGGSFDMDLPGEEPYSGAIVQLFIESTAGFFTNDFDGVSVQLDGEIVPTPGSITLFGAAALTLLRRRET